MSPSLVLTPSSILTNVDTFLQELLRTRGSKGGTPHFDEPLLESSRSDGR